MSGSGRSVLLLLHRCVTGRQTRLFSGIHAGGSWSSSRCCHLLQQQTRTTLCRPRSFHPLAVLKWNHLGLCTKVSLSCCCILGYTDQRVGIVRHSALERSHLFSAYAVSLQSGTPWEDEYLPLPAYQPESEQKEVYIVKVKGLPWSCSAEDILNFFSGEPLGKKNICITKTTKINKRNTPFPKTNSTESYAIFPDIIIIFTAAENIRTQAN